MNGLGIEGFGFRAFWVVWFTGLFGLIGLKRLIPMNILQSKTRAHTAVLVKRAEQCGSPNIKILNLQRCYRHNCSVMPTKTS